MKREYRQLLSDSSLHILSDREVATQIDYARVNLQRAMRMRGVCQAELSMASGVGVNAISRFINGRCTLELGHFLKIAGAMDIPLERLISRP